MENTQITDEGIIMEKPQITDEIIGYLYETKKWTKFLSIVGFVGCGLLVILGVFMGVLMGTMSAFTPSLSMLPSSMISLLYIGIAILYFFPVLYLFKFSVSMGAALDSSDNDQFQMAFWNLKRHYRFVGIMMIVILSLYAVMLVFGLFAAVIGGVSGMY